MDHSFWARIQKFRRPRLILGLTAALALGAGVMLPGSALATTTSSGTTSSTASVTGGGDSVVFVGGIPTGFGTTSISNTYGVTSTPQTIGGWGTGAANQMLGVDDATGTNAGWVATIQASPLTEVAPSGGFATGTSALTMPAGSLEMGAIAGIYPESGQSSTATVPTIDLTTQTPIDGSTPVDLATAPSGSGAGSWGMSWGSGSNFLAINIPNNQQVVDTTNYPSAATPYSSTLTLTMTEN